MAREITDSEIESYMYRILEDTEELPELIDLISSLYNNLKTKDLRKELVDDIVNNILIDLYDDYMKDILIDQIKEKWSQDQVNDKELYHRLIGEFLAEIWPTLGYEDNDIIAKREAWNNWTDSLCKEGLLTDSQYNDWDNPF